MAIFVISDLHLGDAGLARLFHDQSQGLRFADLCTHVARTPGSELVLLGDIFDLTAAIPPKRGLDAFFRGIGPDLRLEQLLKIIREELEREPHLTLSALLDRYPLKYGTIDLLCYIFAAGRNERHRFLEQTIEVGLSAEPKRVARLPEIIFNRGGPNNG